MYLVWMVDDVWVCKVLNDLWCSTKIGFLHKQTKPGGTCSRKMTTFQSYWNSLRVKNEKEKIPAGIFTQYFHIRSTDNLIAHNVLHQSKFILNSFL